MPKELTPEEIEAMRQKVAEHDRKVAEEQAKERLAAVQPFLEIVNGTAFRGLEALLPGLEELSKLVPDGDIHFKALRAGMFGLRQTAEMAVPPIVLPTAVPPSAVLVEQPPVGEA